MPCAASTRAAASPIPEWPPVIRIEVMGVPFVFLVLDGADDGNRRPKRRS